VGIAVSIGTGVRVGVGVLVLVGVLVRVGVSVGGPGVPVSVAERAAEVCMTDQVCAASVSGIPGAIGIKFDVLDVKSHPTSSMRAKIEINARFFRSLFMDPPIP
jgi:hypothetical protein